jgi:hypothetical protein
VIFAFVTGAVEIVALVTGATETFAVIGVVSWKKRAIRDVRARSLAAPMRVAIVPRPLRNERAEIKAEETRATTDPARNALRAEIRTAEMRATTLPAESCDLEAISAEETRVTALCAWTLLRAEIRASALIVAPPAPSSHAPISGGFALVKPLMSAGEFVPS